MTSCCKPNSSTVLKHIAEGFTFWGTGKALCGVIERIDWEGWWKEEDDSADLCPKCRELLQALQQTETVERREQFYDG